ncbi:MAG TPA: cold shock domain-containing protein [Thermomicrobiales bacterium]|jgi:CspA family cold shock protein|nr:cold shock domain-containing protein [Thermomicrobiales bacterium]
MASGTVKVFSKSQGSGWIRPDSGGNLVYVHRSGVVRTDADRAATLEAGQRVEYQVGQREKGPAAINVTVTAS